MPSDPRNPDKEQVPVTVRVMWPDGPSRYWSEVLSDETRFKASGGAFLGAYVCQGCQVPTEGVYRVLSRLEVARKWICEKCLTPESTQKKNSRGEKGKTQPRRQQCQTTT